MKWFRSLDAISATLFVATVAILFGLTIYMVGFPPKKAAGMTSAQTNKKNQLIADAEKSRTALADIKDKTEKYLWRGSTGDIPPMALSKLNSLAATWKVKLTVFRPQKETQASSLSLLPILINVEGPFPQVASFERSLETSKDMKLAVTSVQLTAGDASTNKVSAVIGLVAYVAPAPGENSGASKA